MMTPRKKTQTLHHNIKNSSYICASIKLKTKMKPGVNIVNQNTLLKYTSYLSGRAVGVYPGYMYRKHHTDDTY